MVEYRHLRYIVRPELYIESFIEFCRKLNGTPTRTHEDDYIVVYCDLPEPRGIEIRRKPEALEHETKVTGELYVLGIYDIDGAIKYETRVDEVYAKFIDIEGRNIEEYKDESNWVTIRTRAKRIVFGVDPSITKLKLRVE